MVGHPWGDGCSQLLDLLGFFGSATPAAVDAGGLCLSSCSTTFLARFMTHSISGFRGIIMSRRVASVIAAIGVLKTGSTTLLNSLLRLRGGIRARSDA